MRDASTPWDNNNPHSTNFRINTGANGAHGWETFDRGLEELEDYDSHLEASGQVVHRDTIVHIQTSGTHTKTTVTSTLTCQTTFTSITSVLSTMVLTMTLEFTFQDGNDATLQQRRYNCYIQLLLQLVQPDDYSAKRQAVVLVTATMGRRTITYKLPQALSHLTGIDMSLTCVMIMQITINVV